MLKKICIQSIISSLSFLQSDPPSSFTLANILVPTTPVVISATPVCAPTKAFISAVSATEAVVSSESDPPPPVTTSVGDISYDIYDSIDSEDLICPPVASQSTQQPELLHEATSNTPKVVCLNTRPTVDERCDFH